MRFGRSVLGAMAASLMAVSAAVMPRVDAIVPDKSRHRITQMVTRRKKKPMQSGGNDGLLSRLKAKLQPEYTKPQTVRERKEAAWAAQRTKEDMKRIDANISHYFERCKRRVGWRALRRQADIIAAKFERNVVTVDDKPVVQMRPLHMSGRQWNRTRKFLQRPGLAITKTKLTHVNTLPRSQRKAYRGNGIKLPLWGDPRPEFARAA